VSRRPGRPAKLDDVILLPDGKDPPGKVPRVRWEVIVDRIRSGIPIRTACLSTGVGLSTYYRWMEEGEDRWIDGKLRRARPQYREFRDAATRARAESESVHVARIAKASEVDWKASAWYLERAHGEVWGRHDTVALTGGADGDPEIRTRVTHDIDEGAASKLGELLDLVEGVSRRAREEARPEDGDGDPS
jgi:hypothetical protein